MLRFAWSLSFHRLVFQDHPRQDMVPGTAGRSFWLMELTWERLPAVLWESSILSEKSSLFRVSPRWQCSAPHGVSQSVPWRDSDAAMVQASSSYYAWWTEVQNVECHHNRHSMWSFVSLHCDIDGTELITLWTCQDIPRMAVNSTRKQYQSAVEMPNTILCAYSHHGK